MGEIEQFAIRLQALKDRAGVSFEALAKQTGISRSSLHRYCAGTKLPAGYGPVHTIAKACGASSSELRDLHRLWALADALKTSPTGSQEDLSSQQGERPQPAAPPTGATKRKRKALMAASCVAAVAAAAGIVALVLPDDPPAKSAALSSNAQAVSVHVFNIEGNCQDRKDHVPACSMGLARDPRKKYDADNVVSHRIWHGDVLVTDCVLYDGDRVADETGVATSRWFRVRLNDVPGGHAWLPAVRTHDSPALPQCDH
ncbi:helix-turn-helix transcriptional regulator [Streptomyces sp. SID1328]|uniref:helix-turn-helix domain-containing protein n=1 Tax=Streptomyces sp. SID1328 TaxID=2690250 RepID=UPI0031F79505